MGNLELPCRVRLPGVPCTFLGEDVCSSGHTRKGKEGSCSEMCKGHRESIKMAMAMASAEELLLDADRWWAVTDHHC